MRAVVQRVTRAGVTVAGEVVGGIDRPGLCVLVGVTHDDGPDQVARLDAASVVTKPYPYWHQDSFAERNPPPV